MDLRGSVEIVSLGSNRGSKVFGPEVQPKVSFESIN